MLTDKLNPRVFFVFILFILINHNKALGQEASDNAYKVLFKRSITDFKLYSLENNPTERQGQVTQNINDFILYKSAKYSGDKITSVVTFRNIKINIPLLSKNKNTNYTMVYACEFRINGNRYWGFSFEPVFSHNSRGTVFHVIIKDLDKKSFVVFKGWNESESILDVIGYYTCSNDVVYAQNLNSKITLYKILPNQFVDIIGKSIYLLEDREGNFVVDKKRSNWCH